MKLNIRAKLIGSFLVVVALMLVVAAISWNGLNQLDAAVDHIVHEALPEDEEVRDLQFQLAFQTELYFEYALTLDEDVLHQARAQSDIIFKEIKDNPGVLDDIIKNTKDAESKSFFRSLKGADDTEVGAGGGEAAAFGVSGLTLDEEGNLSFDPARALALGIGFAGFMRFKGRPKVAQLESQLKDIERTLSRAEAAGQTLVVERQKKARNAIFAKIDEIFKKEAGR